MLRSFTERFSLVAVTALVTIAFVGGATALPGDRALVVEDAASGERLLTVPVENGSTVAIEYTHSVEQTPVLDVYVVDGNRLVMTRMEFESYGWGLPATADVELVNGTFVAHPDWSGTELYLSPGRIAGHRLHVADRSYDLVARADARPVRITIVQRSALTAAIDTFDA